MLVATLLSAFLLITAALYRFLPGSALACELYHDRDYRLSPTGRGAVFKCRTCGKKGWRP